MSWIHLGSFVACSLQIVFVLSVLTLSWLGMMCVHELGHVIGAAATGGKVQEVVLHPLKISRTDVSPNPHPGIVVWLGPVIGCFLPLIAWCLVPRRLSIGNRLAQFFAGFCLVANGAYIAIGVVDRVGDCAVMLDNGAAKWMLLAFGCCTIPLGFFLWHGLGSLRGFFERPESVSWKLSCTTACVAIVVAVGLALIG